MGVMLIMQSSLLFLLVLLAGLTVGYAMGRRAGYRHGFASGQAQDKLMLRVHAYQLGYCPICEAVLEDEKEADSENFNG